MITVTKPFFPPKEDYLNIVSKIWDSGWLTNEGPIQKELENKLADFLGVKNLLFVNNGTMALQMAIKSLELSGEIITTPFSFIATSSSIIWENCVPVFVDVDQKTLNIDSAKVQQKITSKTSAIIATHVFGNPCDVNFLEAIAKENHIKLIFDASHAFDVKIKGKSILTYGDISICSTHATKTFHTVEGGIMVTKSKSIIDKLSMMRNFGFKDAISFEFLGTNAKNSELHAAMGVVNLKYIKQIQDKRKVLSELYDTLINIPEITRPCFSEYANKNYTYYPIIFDTENLLLETVRNLKDDNIYPRRYFYPPLSNSLNFYPIKKELPLVNDISKRVLCLPLYYDLTIDNVHEISKIVNGASNLKID